MLKSTILLPYTSGEVRSLAALKNGKGAAKPRYKVDTYWYGTMVDSHKADLSWDHLQQSLHGRFLIGNRLLH